MRKGNLVISICMLIVIFSAVKLLVSSPSWFNNSNDTQSNNIQIRDTLTGDDYVRNTTTAPDVTASGWVRNSAGSSIGTETARDRYLNESRQLEVFVYTDNKTQEELIMLFTSTSQSVARGAIKVDGKWYLGKAPMYDLSNTTPVMLQNDFKIEQVVGDSGLVIAVRVSLETTEGIKSVVVKFQ